jgi:hypothetical protein
MYFNEDKACINGNTENKGKTGILKTLYQVLWEEVNLDI